MLTGKCYPCMWTVCASVIATLVPVSVDGVTILDTWEIAT